MGWTPTERQTEIVAWPDRVRGTPVRHLFVEGPFGSGKSHGTYISLMWEAISRHSGTHFMVAAKTLDTIQNHRDEYVEPFLDELGAWHQLGGKGWEVQSLAGPRTNTFELFAFGELNNPARVRSAQGRHIGGLLVDDALNLSPDLRAMLVSRVRVPDASNLCWWSFNPDSDGHSFYEQMVDNTDLPSDYMNISIAENPHLPGDYIDQLLAQYPFHWQRERYIWGRRSLATGLVYGTAGLSVADGGCVMEPRLLDAFSYSVGVDHAPSNVSAAVLFAHTADGTFLVDEWIHDGRAGVTLDDRQQAMAIWQWATANGARSIDRWTVAHDASGV
ncbi:MAG: phage terminase large subunit, partial [Gammaproteobacteria bacterium]|nr:phage terminase large subunit [Gammaproteobacteria bacterium]